MNVSISPPAAAPLTHTHTHTVTKHIYSALLSDTKRPVYTDLTLITHTHTAENTRTPQPDFHIKCSISRPQKFPMALLSQIHR